MPTLSTNTLTQDPLANPLAAPAPVNSTQNATGGLIQTASSTLPTDLNELAQYTPLSTAQLETYKPTIREVYAPNETVQGQLESILAKDSPLMQRARTLATQQMAQRGLVNSSMAAGATEAALIDRATPIAAADAGTYATRSLAAMGAENEAAQFNAGQKNALTLQEAQQKFAAAQSTLERAQQVALADKSIAAQKDLQLAQQEFQSAQAVLDRAQQLMIADKQISAASAQQSAALGAQAAMQASQLSFQGTQAQLDRQNQQALLLLQNNLNNANVSTNFAATTAQNTLQTIQQITLDPNLSPDAKKVATQNVIDAANSTLTWSSTLYKTTMPTLSLPGTTTTTTAPAPAPAPTPAPAPDIGQMPSYDTGIYNDYYSNYGSYV